MLDVLEDESMADELKRVYDKYHVTNVAHCAPRIIARADATMIQLWVLVIACFIGFAGLIASITVCCMHCK